MIAGLRGRQDRAADDALHVRGGRALRPHRRGREGRDRGPGDAARPQAGVGEGAIVEIEVYGIGDDALAAVRALDGVTRRRRRGARPGAGDRDPDRGRRRGDAGDHGAARRRQARPRDDARADARGCVRRARHRPRAGGRSREPAAAHDDARLEAALQAGVAQPVLPLHRDRHARDLRDDGVLPLPGWREAGDPRRGRGRARR